ncbi:MAG: Cna B-type domain-containing protein, partial [Oscillospiraceae bacterium]
SSYLYYGDWRNGGYTRISESSMTYDVSEDANGQQTVTFSIPASLHDGQKFRIEYAAALDKDYLMKYKDTQEKVKFKNIVSEGDFTSEQTQTIERSLISKTGSDPESSYDGYIDYSIDVNPTAETLSNNGKITVIDTVNYEYKAFVPTLKDINVYVVETDESGNEVLTELDPAKYELSYTNDNKDAKFTAVLPDKTHLKIKYRYFCIYKNPEWFEPIDSGIEIYNSVNLEFDNGLQKTDYKDRYYLNKESDAHAATDDYLQIRKVDADNYAVRLKGAEFSLYKWDGSLWLPVTATDESTAGKIIPTWGTAEDDEPYLFVTDDKGKALLPELESGVVYKLVEKTAPTDYIKATVPYYFAEESTPATLPADVKSADVMVLLKGGVITMPNNKMVKTQVDVQKYWHDAPGFSGIHDGVEVQLYQSKTDPSGKTDGPTITIGYIDGNGKNDKQSFTVQPGADAVMRMKTYGAWLTNGTEGFGINGQGINWYNIPEQHQGKLIIAGNDPQIKLQTQWETNNIPADWYDQEGWYNEFEITYKNVTEDMEFIFYFTGAGKYNDYSQYKLLVDISEPDAVKGLPDDAVAIGNPVTLNNDNNWYYKWDNIPKTDEYGYNYYYYVQEVTTVTDYTPGYDNNGANEGTINITNKGKGYTNEMPKTGGIGNKPMIITGIILISGSSALYILSKRRRKRC